MHIAIVTPFAPYDGVPHAGGAFLYAYVSHLSNAHTVDLVCVQPPDDRVRAAFSASVAVHFCPPKPGGTTSRLRLQGRTLTGFNIGVAEVDALVGDRGTRQLLAGADIVNVHWSELLRVVPHLRRQRRPRPIVATAYDIYSQGMMRAVRAQRKEHPDIERIPFRRRLFAPVGIYTEAYFFNKCDLVQVFKHEDVSALRRSGLRRPIMVVDPLIDHSPQALGSPDAKRMIFVAAFSRGPNAEGARWFISNVWPAVHNSVTGASLVLAGEQSDEVLSGSPAPGASATGYVDDLKPYYDASTIVVAPLLRGAGLKFKVPQAWAYGLPVVTTTVGAEGMPPRCPALITDDPAEMSRSIIELLKAPDKARELGEVGRRWAADVFDFSRSMNEVERRFEELVRATP
jgi:glycosyltransferase involved in cell wall biosynthesis